jgi:Flp pilus assembly protein TadD
MEKFSPGLAPLASRFFWARPVPAPPHLARHEFAAARAVLEAAIQAHPMAVSPRIFLSYVLLQEGRDLRAAEQALRAVLELDPGHPQTRQNLEVLLRQQGPPAV